MKTSHGRGAGTVGWGAPSPAASARPLGGGEGGGGEAGDEAGAQPPRHTLAGGAPPGAAWATRADGGEPPPLGPDTGPPGARGGGGAAVAWPRPPLPPRLRSTVATAQAAEGAAGGRGGGGTVGRPRPAAPHGLAVEQLAHTAHPRRCTGKGGKLLTQRGSEGRATALPLGPPGAQLPVENGGARASAAQPPPAPRRPAQINPDSTPASPRPPRTPWL